MRLLNDLNATASSLVQMIIGSGFHGFEAPYHDPKCVFLSLRCSNVLTLIAFHDRNVSVELFSVSMIPYLSLLHFNAFLNSFFVSKHYLPERHDTTDFFTFLVIVVLHRVIFFDGICSHADNSDLLCKQNVRYN